jgi:hypothetical protein
VRPPAMPAEPLGQPFDPGNAWKAGRNAYPRPGRSRRMSRLARSLRPERQRLGADIIDMLTMHRDARRKVARLLGEIKAAHQR